MQYDHSHNEHVDSRIIIYRIVKQVTVILVIGLFLKSCVFDIVTIRGDQMAPTIVKGDHILIFKTSYLPLLRSISGAHLNRKVLFTYPLEKRKHGCLRISAASGDTISIDSGRTFVNRHKTFLLPRYDGRTDVLPREFSARDFMDPYRVSAKGDTLRLDSLTMREFFFASSIIRQENPDKKFMLQQVLFLEDTAYTDYTLTDFSLFKGSLSAVPDQYRYDWYFWDRLQEYLRFSQNDSTVHFKFTLLMDGTPVDKYTVRKSYSFLLADNWTGGLDSRYFGPVQRSLCIGSSILVLWSYGDNGKGANTFRVSRFGRILF